MSDPVVDPFVTAPASYWEAAAEQQRAMAEYWRRMMTPPPAPAPAPAKSSARVYLLLLIIVMATLYALLLRIEKLEDSVGPGVDAKPAKPAGRDRPGAS